MCLSFPIDCEAVKNFEEHMEVRNSLLQYNKFTNVKGNINLSISRNILSNCMKIYFYSLGFLSHITPTDRPLIYFFSELIKEVSRLPISFDIIFYQSHGTPKTLSSQYWLKYSSSKCLVCHPELY